MINDTNRDIHHFETDDLGNTKRVVLNTDEPLGLVDEDVNARLEALENRLNALTGSVGNDIVQIPHGGTGADNAGDAAANIVSNLQLLDSSDLFQYGLVAQRLTGGSSAGGVYRVGQDVLADKIGALKASNNLSDVDNGVASLENLYKDVPVFSHPGEIPIKDWIDTMYVILSKFVQIGDNDYRVESSRYSLLNFVNNYLSEYFLRRDNDLSDVNGVPYAVKNLFDGLSNLETSLLSDNNEIIVNRSSFPALNGKITLGSLFDSYLVGKLSDAYGLTNPYFTPKFLGNAATATLSMLSEATKMSDLSSSDWRSTLHQETTGPLSTNIDLSGAAATLELTRLNENQSSVLVGVYPYIMTGYGIITLKQTTVTKRSTGTARKTEITVTYDASRQSDENLQYEIRAVYYLVDAMSEDEP